MIELILVYCLAAAPDRCLERHEPLVPPASMISCTMRAQFKAQEYVESHPLYRLAGFRCEQDKPREDPA